MKFNKIYLALVAFLAMGMVACDGEEENASWKAGPELLIYTPDGAYAPSFEGYVNNEYSFAPAGYDIREDYTWTVDGAGAEVITSEGEFLEVRFTQPGTYTVSVANADDTGDITVTILPKTVSFEAAEYEFQEGLETDTIMIPVVFDDFPVTPTTVTYEISGTFDGENYTLLSSTSLDVDLEEGETPMIEIEIPANMLMNSTDGTPENLMLTLTGVTTTGGAATQEVVLGDAETITTTITIMDDMKMPMFASADTMAITEAGEYEMVINLSSPSDEAVNVSYSLTGNNGAPVVGVIDASETPGMLMFAPGETSKTITLNVTELALMAEAQYVAINLTSLVSDDAEAMLDEDNATKVLMISEPAEEEEEVPGE